MVSINHSEWCISMNFYFHFIQRIDRLVSEFPFFLKTWMHIWFLLKRERESREEKERELMGNAQRDVNSLQYVPGPPAIHPQFQFSAAFPNEIVLISNVKCHKREVTGPRTTECQTWGVGSPFAQPCAPSLWLPISIGALAQCIFPAVPSRAWILEHWLLFCISELICEKCLGYCLIGNKQWIMFVVSNTTFIA